ncbi:MAG: glutamyl-tRNA reductase [Dehalococcoidia bacterium]|nr:glutamyl-tRNA reductase [Dehalococcoidia bacterium]
MHVSLVGINHRTAPIEMREKAAIGPDSLHAYLHLLRRHLQHGVILSTCNRTEVYSTGSRAGDVDQACVDFLGNSMGLTESATTCFYVMSDRVALEHLFDVSCGLDSMIIGEYEVLGQVSQALEAAEKSGTVNLPLRRIFESAIRTGRRARNETGISRNPLSISSIAVNKALDIVDDIGRCKIVIIGAGEAGRLALRVASGRGAADMAVVSRTLERAVRITGTCGGRPVGPDKLAVELRDADIVIACAASPHPVLHHRQVSDVMNTRPQRPLIIIDIALPRNVEPDVGSIYNVHLYNIDDLNKLADNHRQEREAEAAAVKEIIAEEAEILMNWLLAYSARPAIKSLMVRAEKIRAAQYHNSIKKMASLSEEEKQHIDLLTRSIVDKILRYPILYLKEGGDADRMKSINRIFGLDDGKEL